MKLFRVFRNKKKTDLPKIDYPNPASILFANTRQDLPSKKDPPSPEKKNPKTGLQNLALKPVHPSRSVDKNKSWMRQPLRPNTKSKPNPQSLGPQPRHLPAKNYLDLTL